MGAGVGSGGVCSFSFPRDVNALKNELASRDVDADTNDMGVKVGVDAVDDNVVDIRVHTATRAGRSASRGIEPGPPLVEGLADVRILAGIHE